ncbi:MAG TPA: hypothetical protein IAC50_02115 [Candidatus Copromorpha excrementigallinarum]|uniref:YtxH domain-containing protein n=1 Tax=Candidatus Allocopromorpha excrementigallinarum TaxID=2840742 RepID=A0A9D1HZA7_9FIRM|nr:hypothetical protein [Candidatus Copromorpha excrementigallinarum]
MGKAGSAILGLGLAGAAVGIYAYMSSSPGNRRNMKRDLKGAVNDIKRAADRIVDMN